MRDSIGKRVVVAALSLPFVNVVSAWATEAGHGATAGHVDFSTLTYPAINFSVYLVLLCYLYRHYGLKALSAYRSSVRNRIESAHNALCNADHEVKQAEDRQVAIQSEISAIIRELEIEGDKMVEALLAQARHAAAQKETDVQRQIRTEFAQAQAEIRTQIVAQAAVRARALLHAGLSEEEDRVLRNEVLGSLMPY